MKTTAHGATSQSKVRRERLRYHPGARRESEATRCVSQRTSSSWTSSDAREPRGCAGGSRGRRKAETHGRGCWCSAAALRTLAAAVRLLRGVLRLRRPLRTASSRSRRARPTSRRSSCRHSGRSNQSTAVPPGSACGCVREGSEPRVAAKTKSHTEVVHMYALPRRLAPSPGTSRIRISVALAKVGQGVTSLVPSVLRPTASESDPTQQSRNRSSSCIRHAPSRRRRRRRSCAGPSASCPACSRHESAPSGDGCHARVPDQADRERARDGRRRVQVELRPRHRHPE